MIVNAHLFYKVFFDIETSDVPLTELAIGIVLKWLCGKYLNNSEIKEWDETYFADHGDFYSKSNRVVAHTASYTPTGEVAEGPLSRQCWALRLDEADRQYPNIRTWITEIGIEVKNTSIGEGHIYIATQYSDRAGYLGTPIGAPEPTIPKLISFFQECSEWRIRKESEKFQSSPHELKAGEGFDFYNELKNQNRKIPFILISSIYSQNEYKIPINPETLAKHLAGNAYVFYMDELLVEDELYHVMPPHLKCNRGTVRVYMPNLKTDSIDAKRHRYFTYEQISEIEQGRQNSFVYLLRQALSERMTSAEQKRVIRIETCDDRYNQERASVLRKKYQQQQTIHENESENLKDLSDLYQITDIQREALQRQNDELLLHIEDLQEQNQELMETNERLQRQERYARTTCDEVSLELKKLSDATCDLRKISAYPSTPKAIVDYYLCAFSNRIAFTEQGLDSIESCETAPQILWACLYDMCTILYEIYKSNSTNIEKQFADSSTFSLTLTESPSTRNNKDLMKLREDIFEGTPISIEAHVKKGKTGSSAIRVYYKYIEEKEVIVIGWLGQHLDTEGTRKQH